MFRKTFALIALTISLIAPLFGSAAEAQASGSSTQCSMFYTVQSGDNLYRIALRHNATVSSLQAWNNINNANRIYAGQSLCVGRQTIVDDTASGQAYTVRRGDTLSAIARWHGVSMQVLARINNITNTNRIFVGQVITIPDVTIQPAG